MRRDQLKVQMFKMLNSTLLFSVSHLQVPQMQFQVSKTQKVQQLENITLLEHHKLASRKEMKEFLQRGSED